MEKQRLLKLTPLQQKILAKVFLVTQKYFRPEQAERMQDLREKTQGLRKGRLYLNDEEFDCTVQSLNAIRNEFLEAGKNSTCFDEHPPAAAGKQIPARTGTVPLTVYLPYISPGSCGSCSSNRIRGDFLFLWKGRIIEKTTKYDISLSGSKEGVGVSSTE